MARNARCPPVDQHRQQVHGQQRTVLRRVLRSAALRSPPRLLRCCFGSLLTVPADEMMACLDRACTPAERRLSRSSPGNLVRFIGFGVRHNRECLTRVAWGTASILTAGERTSSCRCQTWDGCHLFQNRSTTRARDVRCTIKCQTPGWPLHASRFETTEQRSSISRRQRMV